MATDPTPRPPLDAARLVAAELGWPEGQVEIVETTASTNPLASERARRGAAEGLVVVTEHQTAGRGRMDRRWETPARAALTFSLLLRPTVPPERWPWLPLLAGVGVARALRAQGAPARLKWPNDLLVGERKIGGILMERVDTAAGPAAVVGVGLNVTTTPEELPIEAATSLAIEGVPTDRTELLGGVLASLAEVYRGWLAEPGALRAAYSALCGTVPDRAVVVSMPDGSRLEGTTVGICEDGGLQLSGPHGPVTLHAGDVEHVRPART